MSQFFILEKRGRPFSARELAQTQYIEVAFSVFVGGLFWQQNGPFEDRIV